VTEDGLKGALARIVAPLVEADEGELYLVKEEPKKLHIHLGGRFAGCPGNELVRREILEPLVRSVRPGAILELTSGALLPEGAQRIPADPP
jgi:hypothetical protein